MSVKIQKIEKVTAGEQIYHSLRKNIVSHQWKENEKLPSEMELASSFGVNRLTVRTALQRLAALGLVETRVGDGTYVKKFEFSEYIDAAQDLMDDPKLMDDVCEFRKLIEVECARLAILRATEEDIEELQRRCEKHDHLMLSIRQPLEQEQLEQLVQSDMDFHEQICWMSHNTLYSYCFAMARPTIRRYVSINLRQRLKGWEKKDVSAVEGDFRHRAIVKTIQDRDFEECRRLYLDMIDYNIEL